MGHKQSRIPPEQVLKEVAVLQAIAKGVIGFRKEPVSPVLDWSTRYRIPVPPIDVTELDLKFDDEVYPPTTKFAVPRTADVAVAAWCVDAPKAVFRLQIGGTDIDVEGWLEELVAYVPMVAFTAQKVTLTPVDGLPHRIGVRWGYIAAPTARDAVIAAPLLWFSIGGDLHEARRNSCGQRQVVKLTMPWDALDAEAYLPLTSERAMHSGQDGGELLNVVRLTGDPKTVQAAWQTLPRAWWWTADALDEIYVLEERVQDVLERHPELAAQWDNRFCVDDPDQYREASRDCNTLRELQRWLMHMAVINTPKRVPAELSTEALAAHHLGSLVPPRAEFADFLTRA